MRYDIIVIGGGPGGYVAAIKAAQLGKKTCIIEKGEFGGTCLNIGCIPTKALLKSVEVMNEIKQAGTYGIKISDEQDISLDLEKVQERKKHIVSQLVSGVGSLLKKNKVDIVKGNAAFIDKNTIQAGDKKIEGESVIVATGSVAKSLPIEMDSSVPVYTSTEILEMTEHPQKLAIIGGGVIGIELAYYLANLGVKVSIIEFLSRILPMVDEEITEAVDKQLRGMGVEIYTGARVMELKNRDVILEKNDALMSIRTEALLMAVGRQANIDGLNLEKIGIKMEKGAVQTDERMATNVEGIYAVGDVNGRLMLAHTASMEAITAVENICGISSKMNYDKIPSAIYIQPEIASIGLTEEEARSKYREIKVGRFPLMANGKAKIQGEERGLVKVITEAPLR